MVVCCTLLRKYIFLYRIRFLREAQIMLNIKHSNIICVYGVCIGKDPLMIVMELAEGGSLFDRLKKQRGVVPAPHEENENYAYEICAGMAYLEEKPVCLIHADLLIMVLKLLFR